MFYTYKAMAKNGSVKFGEIESTSKNEALRLLTERGLTPFEVTSSVEQSSAKLGSRRPFARFAGGFGQLLASGIDIENALLMMERTENSAVLRGAITRMRQRVASGETLSSAISTCGVSLPGYVAALVRAGETNAKLGDVWLKVAEIETRRIKTREEIRAALLYPAFLLVVALASVALILLVVAPSLEPIMRAAATPPQEVVILLSASEWLQQNWAMVLLIVLGLLIVLLTRARSKSGREQFDRIAIGIPGLGKLLRYRDSARFLNASALMVQAGLSLPETLSSAARAATNTALRSRLEPLSGNVRDGRPLSASCMELEALPEQAIRLISVGEETGNLADMMTQAAMTLDEEGDRLQKSMTSALTPTLTVILGGVVGAVVLTMLNAIMSVNSAGL